MLYNLRLCQLAHCLGPDNVRAAEVQKLVLEATFATLTNVNFSHERFCAYLTKAAALVKVLEGLLRDQGRQVPPAAAGLPFELPSDKTGLLLASGPAGLLARSAVVMDDDVFGAVEMATYGLKGVIAYFYHAEHLAPSYSDKERQEVYDEIFRVGAYLAVAGTTAPDSGTALDVALGECLAVGALNLKVMKLLDHAHCTAFGSPRPELVSTASGGGRPAILVSGHDLSVLHKLLTQSEGCGVDVYTHGEMLPAHGYPRLRSFAHLKGHYGTHWGNQLHEFRRFPGPVLMTSNCLRPPTRKYADRLWTAGPVGFASVPALEDDFGPLIQQALSLPPFVGEPDADRPKLHVGFGHEAVLGLADKLVAAVKSGALQHIFVIGGCDGAESSRSYFTELAAQTPPESLILTLGCGKFRLNAHDHGMLGDVPRLVDLGQCNDAYSAVVIAVKLAEALGCGVHELPLHFAVSWFEQKAVAVLLTLLHLELKNIRIGPAVPAFLTPRVAALLNSKFGLMGIDAAHEDLSQMLRSA